MISPCKCNERPRWPMKNEVDAMFLACTYVRHQRDEILLQVIRILNRHRNQVDYGLPSTLTQDEAREVAHYAQGLRDVPQQKGFPHAVEWPQKPVCLNTHVIG